MQSHLWICFYVLFIFYLYLIPFYLLNVAIVHYSYWRLIWATSQHRLYLIIGLNGFADEVSQVKLEIEQTCLWQNAYDVHYIAIIKEIYTKMSNNDKLPVICAASLQHLRIQFSYWCTWSVLPVCSGVWIAHLLLLLCMYDFGFYVLCCVCLYTMTVFCPRITFFKFPPESWLHWLLF